MGIAVLRGDFQGNQTTVVVEVFARPSVRKNRVSRIVFSAPIKTKTYSKIRQKQDLTTKETSNDLYFNKEAVENTTTTGKSSVKESFKNQGAENTSVAKSAINPTVKGTVFYENPVSFQEENFFLRALRFVVVRLPQILETLLFVSISVLLAMMLAIAFSKNSFKSPDLMIKGIFYVVILFVFFIFEKQNLLSLIPHTLGY